jgi:ribose/xylose/arabinose/galactoside ABC-type transport system permease subunit
MNARVEVPRRRSVIVRHQDLSALIVLVVLVIVFAISAPGFTNPANIQSIFAVVAVTACIAIGQNLIILAGEIDVSLGSVLALAGFCAGFVGLGTGSIVLTVLTAVAVGALAGLVNGLLVGFTPVPSIVVTLGTLYAFQGAALLVSDSRNIVGLGAEPSVLGSGMLFGIPHSVLTLTVVFVLVLVVRRNTRWGRDLVALGGNPVAARTMGVPVPRVLITTFVVAGALTGVAAVIYLGQLGGIQNSIVNGTTILQVVAAVAIGGTSIDGGRGTDAAPILGALIISVVSAGIVILGVPGDWVPLVYGVALLLAVARDRFFTPGVRRVR